MTWNTFNICDICAATQKIVTVSHHQQRFISKLCYTLNKYQNYNNLFFVGISLQKVCEYCLKTNVLLNDIEKRILINPWHLYNMQTNPHNLNSNDGNNQPPQEQPHQYNCDCHECQIKFGSLPLLVQVIECQEKSKSENESEATSSTSAKNNEKDSATDLTINSSKPSTSFAHVNISNKRVMACPHCNKTFTHRGDFNKHVRKHTGEQPYTCDICNKKFAHTSNLNRHLRVHSGDRPFICTVCNKNFNRKDKLDLHKKTKRCKKFSERQL